MLTQRWPAVWKSYVAKILCGLAVFGFSGVVVAQTGLKESTTEPQKVADVVKPTVDLSVDRLPAGGQCQVLVRLTIERGWHIGANPAINKDDYPTVVEYKGKLDTKLIKLKYPEGKKYRLDKESPVQMVYEDRVEIRGILEVPESAGGAMEQMEVTIRCAPCKDGKCLIPQPMTLKAKVEVAKAGEPVKAINAKLFPPNRNNVEQ